MSIRSVNNHIRRAVEDGHISYDEARSITSRKDKIGEDAVSVGDFLDKDEFKMISDLQGKIVGGEITASKEAKYMIDDILLEGPDNRLAHIAKKGAQFGTAGFLTFGFFGTSLASGGVGAAVGAGIGALVGAFDD